VGGAEDTEIRANVDVIRIERRHDNSMQRRGGESGAEVSPGRSTIERAVKIVRTEPRKARVNCIGIVWVDRQPRACAEGTRVLARPLRKGAGAIGTLIDDAVVI